MFLKAENDISCLKFLPVTILAHILLYFLIIFLLPAYKYQKIFFLAVIQTLTRAGNHAESTTIDLYQCNVGKKICLFLKLISIHFDCALLQKIKQRESL